MFWPIVQFISNIEFLLKSVSKQFLHHSWRSKRLVVRNDLNLNFLLFHVLQITSTASDPDLGFTIVSCFISNNSNPKVESKYNLIHTVCPTDDSVRFYSQRDFPIPPAKMESKSFSFTFNSTFKMLLFLHCEISLCSKKSNGDRSLPLVCK